MRKISQLLPQQIQDTRDRLDEAAETLRALRSGEVDAIVTSSSKGDRVYTLKGADEAYQLLKHQSQATGRKLVDIAEAVTQSYLLIQPAHDEQQPPQAS